RITTAHHDGRLGPDLLLVAVVEDDLDRAAHEIQELVAIGMHLPPVDGRPVEVGDDADRVAVDALWRPGRRRHDRRDAAACDLGDLAGEGFGRLFEIRCHAYFLPA